MEAKQGFTRKTRAVGKADGLSRDLTASHKLPRQSAQRPSASARCVPNGLAKTPQFPDDNEKRPASVGTGWKQC